MTGRSLARTRRTILAVAALAAAVFTWPTLAQAGNCVGGSNNAGTCASLSACPGGFCDSVATPTATPTATVSPTVTATPTVTPTPVQPRSIEQARERDSSTSAKVGVAAPRALTLVADAGSVVDNGKVCVRFANSFRIRGMTDYINAAGSECTLTLSVAGKTVLTHSLVGIAGKSSYIRTKAGNASVDVPPDAEVCLLTEVTGTNTGLSVVLDTIP